MEKNTKFKRIIFSDVDGTIYPFPSKILHPETKNFIENLKQKHDAEFVIATGNATFQKIIDLAKKLNSNYIITNGGGAVYDIQKKQHIMTAIMEPNEVKKVLEIAKKYNFGMYAFGINHNFDISLNPQVKEFLSQFFEFYDWIPITDFILNESILKLEFAGHSEDVSKFYKLLKQNDIQLNIINLRSHIEITPQNISKGYAIKWMCENVFKTDVDNVMSIGDSPNDISMLSIAGYSYAMGNADEETEKYAKYFTSDVEQLGLIEAINDYIYRTRMDQEKKLIATQRNKTYKK